jgi:Na+/phosphate symporter
MATILLPLCVAIAGALVYAFAANGKLAELGRILFFVGALVTVWFLGGHVIKL